MLVPLLFGVPVLHRHSQQACKVLRNDILTAPFTCFQRAGSGRELFHRPERNLLLPGNVLGQGRFGDPQKLFSSLSC